MPFFKIFRNPVQMIKIMSEIQVTGKLYKKHPEDSLADKIEKLIESLGEQFDLSGVPREVTDAHAQIMFEMTIKGENIPSLAALEYSLMHTLDESDLEFGYADNGQKQAPVLTDDENKLVDDLLKKLGGEGEDG